MLLNETLRSLSGAAHKIPPHRGRRCHPSTIFRWIKDGVRLRDGTVLRLDAIRLAGRWLTSDEALERFVTAMTQDATPESSRPAPPRTPGQRQRASDRAAKKLESMGI